MVKCYYIHKIAIELSTNLPPVPIIMLDIKAVPGIDLYHTTDSIPDQSHSIIENTMYNIL